MTTKLNTRLNELLKSEDNDLKRVKAFLTIDGYKDSEVNALLKEKGLLKKKVPFAESFYNFLADKQRTEEEAITYIDGGGEFGETSANVKKHKSHYLSIFRFSIALYEKVEGEKEKPVKATKRVTKKETKQ